MSSWARQPVTPVVIIVDNEQGLLTLFNTMIRRQGYETILANGGSAALDMLDQVTPDLMILDMAMPNVSGLDVLRYVINIPRLDTMRILVLTALGPGPAPDDVAGRIAEWLTKPIHPDDLIAAVRAQLEG
jgi:DNA-binding response OmpR family regulator